LHSNNVPILCFNSGEHIQSGSPPAGNRHGAEEEIGTVLGKGNNERFSMRSGSDVKFSKRFAVDSTLMDRSVLLYEKNKGNESQVISRLYEYPKDINDNVSVNTVAENGQNVKKSSRVVNIKGDPESANILYFKDRREASMLPSSERSPMEKV